MKFLRAVALTCLVLLSLSLTDVSGLPVASEDADADDIVVLSALKPAVDSGDAEVQEPQDSSEEIDYDAWHHGGGDGDEDDESAVIPILTPVAKPEEDEEAGRDVRSADAQEDHYHQDADDDHLDYGHVEPHSDHSLQYDEDHSDSSEESDEMRRKRRSVITQDQGKTAVPDLISEDREDDVVVVESCDDSRRVINCGGMSERAESIECAAYRAKCPEEKNSGSFVDTFVSCGGFC